jgi:hypothetical protein
LLLISFVTVSTLCTCAVSISFGRTRSVTEQIRSPLLTSMLQQLVISFYALYRRLNRKNCHSRHPHVLTRHPHTLSARPCVSSCAFVCIGIPYLCLSSFDREITSFVTSEAHRVRLLDHSTTAIAALCLPVTDTLNTFLIIYTPLDSTIYPLLLSSHRSPHFAHRALIFCQDVPYSPLESRIPSSTCPSIDQVTLSPPIAHSTITVPPPRLDLLASIRSMCIF